MLHSRFKLTEERILELEDRSVEKFKLRDRGKQKKSQQSLRENTNIYIMGVRRARRGKTPRSVWVKTFQVY